MKSSFRLTTSLILAAALSVPLLLGVSTPGYAQIEEILVVARKKEESMQEVPLAITAIGVQQIERLGIRDVRDVVNQDTSVQFDVGFTPSDTRLSIRGLSPTRGRPNAATLIDGIDISSEAVTNAGGSLLIDPRLIDIERIEIIKGPQSALYGRSAFAGAVQYITKDPPDALEARVNLDVNNDKWTNLTASVGGPITDTFGALVNGLYWDNDGIYDNQITANEVGGGEGKGIALTLKWEPTDRLDFKFRTDYANDEFGAPAQADVPFNRNLNLYNIAPQVSQCGVDPVSGETGWLADPLCAGSAAQQLNAYLTNPVDAVRGTNVDMSDTGILGDAFIFNSMIAPAYVGDLPDREDMVRPNWADPSYPDRKFEDSIYLSPNYQNGPGATDPSRAEDYEGSEREVTRLSLVFNYDLNDQARFSSLTAYTDADVTTQQDIDKYAELSAGTNPGSRLDDSYVGFNQNTFNNTEMFSQELRLAFDANDSLSITGGVQFWAEDVVQTDRNSSTIMGSTGCFVNPGATGDSTYVPFVQANFNIYDFQNECGQTRVPGRTIVTSSAGVTQTLLAHTFDARIGNETRLERETDHFSLYGAFDWQIAEKWNFVGEARFTQEDNSVTGPRMAPCWEGMTDTEYRLQDTIGRGNSGVPPDQPGAVGQTCKEPLNVISGPSSVTLCGSGGRCDTAALSGSTQNVPGAGGPVDLNYPEWGWNPYGFSVIDSFQISYKRGDSYWTPKATVQFFPNAETMLYGSWAVAKKPGGFSLLTSGGFGLDADLNNEPNEIDFDPEKMTVYELGWKTTLFESLRFNGAAFFQDFTDKQVTVQAVINGQLGNTIENASGAEVWGLEFDATWFATENLTLGFGWTFLDTEYTDYTTRTTSFNEIARVGNCVVVERLDGSLKSDGTPNTECMVSRTGNKLEKAPDNAGLATFNYGRQFGGGDLGWYASGQWRYTDDRFIEDVNRIIMPAHSITDIQFGIESDTWDVQLYVDNLLDDDTIRSAGTGPGISVTDFRVGLVVNIPPGVVAGPKLPTSVYTNMPPPRQYGIRVNFRFGG